MVDVFHEYQFHGRQKNQHFIEIKVDILFFLIKIFRTKENSVLELTKIDTQEEKNLSQLKSSSKIEDVIICPDAKSKIILLKINQFIE
jgi:hypothetical protein